VNRSTNELTSIDVLYSINTKTEPAGSLSPDVPAKADYLTGSNISISDLLDYVNKYYPDILPEDILKHYNYNSRPEGVLGESVLYQNREEVSYENIDLSTLDDEELKVYNNRGWSYSLFVTKDSNGKVNTENLRLLQEKFSELNSKKRQRTDNVLADGTRVIEVNNKLVLIGGTYEEPQVHSVLVINTNNATDDYILKEIVLNDIHGSSTNKENFKALLEDVQTYAGEEQVRVYSQEDFSYIRGRDKSWQRAEIPSSFKDYGYTKQFQDRGRNNAETERGVSDSVNKSDLRFAIDDTINDWLETDLLYITRNNYYYLHKEITALCSHYRAANFLSPTFALSIHSYACQNFLNCGCIFNSDNAVSINVGKRQIYILVIVACDIFLNTGCICYAKLAVTVNISIQLIKPCKLCVPFCVKLIPKTALAKQQAVFHRRTNPFGHIQGSRNQSHAACIIRGI
jgi:hypothetical protein